MKKQLLTFLLCSCSITSVLSQAVYCNKVISGYIPSWRDASDVNYNELTHAFFAFIGSDASGTLCTYESSGSGTIVGPAIENSPSILNNFNQFLAACNASKTKKIISIGGYGCDPYMNAMVSGGNLTKFVTNLMDFVNKYNLDGIDIDWEDVADATQSANWGKLCDALRVQTTAKNKLLFATVGAGYRAPNFPHAKVATCDFVQLMAYDNTATWSSSPAGNHSTVADANDAITKWAGYGVPKSKMIIGVPFYGYQQPNSGGLKTKDWTYKDFVAAYPSAGDVDNFPVPGTSETIGLNGMTTIKAKTNIGYTQLSGTMVWEMTGDVQYTNPKSLHKAMMAEMLKLCPTGHGNNPVSVMERDGNGTKVFYNAWNHRLEISLNTQEQTMIRLSNLLGQEVFSENLGVINTASVSLDKVHLEEGIYLVSVYRHDQQSTFRVFIGK